MAAASGFASSLSLLNSAIDSNWIPHCSPSTSSSSMACFPSQARIFHTALKIDSRFLREGSLSLKPRCQLATESKPSGVSPLELLKTSATDRYTKERSSIVVIGFNVHAAPVGILEKLSIPKDKWSQGISELCRLNHIEEAAVLSTCNRLEIYAVALSERRGVKEVTEWMSKISGVPVSVLSQYRFLLSNKTATRHLFEVSAGLDTAASGVDKILSQLEHVVKSEQEVPGFDRKISGLFNHAIKVGEQVSSSAAVQLALVRIPESSIAALRVLVVGPGKMGKLVIKHLVAKGCKKIVVVGGTEDEINALQEELKHANIVFQPLSELMACTAEADVILTSNPSETPLFLKEHVQTLPCVSSQIGGQKLFIDISAPRNVGMCISDLETARVYNWDDIKEIMAANKKDGLRNALIEKEVENFEAWMDSLGSGAMIDKLRAYAHRIIVAEVDKCLSKLRGDISQEQQNAIKNLCTDIVDQLLHGPIQKLQCDEADNQALSEILENMHALNRMFELDEEISVLEQKILAKMEKNQK